MQLPTITDLDWERQMFDSDERVVFVHPDDQHVDEIHLVAQDDSIRVEVGPDHYSRVFDDPVEASHWVRKRMHAHD